MKNTLLSKLQFWNFHLVPQRGFPLFLPWTHPMGGERLNLAPLRSPCAQRRACGIVCPSPQHLFTVNLFFSAPWFFPNLLHFFRGFQLSFWKSLCSPQIQQMSYGKTGHVFEVPLAYSDHQGSAGVCLSVSSASCPCPESQLPGGCRSQPFPLSAVLLFGLLLLPVLIALAALGSLCAGSFLFTWPFSFWAEWNFCCKLLRTPPKQMFLVS